jgi:hypothetical protein
MRFPIRGICFLADPELESRKPYDGYFVTIPRAVIDNRRTIVSGRESGHISVNSVFICFSEIIDFVLARPSSLEMTFLKNS